MFTWGFIFLATGIVFTIFILGIPLFIKAPKTQPTIIRIAGVGLSFIVFLSVTFLLFNEQSHPELEGTLPVYKSIFVALVPGIFVCFSLQILFIRSTRKTIFDLKAIFICLTLLSIFLGGLLLFSTYINRLGEPYIYSATVFNIYRSLVFSLWMLWCFYETKQSLKKDKNFIFLLVLILSALLFIQTIAWVIFLIVDYRTNGVLRSQFGGMPNLDMNIRIIRGGIFCAFEVLLSIYWVQRYSLNAIEERQRQEKIQQLLQEKDMLIDSLSNSSTLIESGALSAGLAHELNQFLGRIALNRDEIVQLVSQSNAKPDDLKVPLDNILQANQSAASLIVSLRKLFNRGEEESSLCNVDDLVKDVVSLYVARIRKSNIEVVLDLHVSEGQLIWESLFRQVVANLLSNAIEALDTSFQSEKVIRINSTFDHQGDYCLTITDNGPGIDPEQESKIFSLFSTTKSSGTGIGLWLSRFIIERHKGSLSFKNLPDNGGVSFFLTLPKGIHGI